MMQAPRQPDNEAARHAALQKLRLLDTEAEERFDRLTRLAKHLFSVPIALVSLVDENRQWFKSRQGLDACETGRDISFCGHTIINNAIFEIIDASLDPRFADNPLVSGPPHIRFYAGAPLTTLDGYRIGTLCLIDTKPRQLTAIELSSLRDLADCVEAEVNQIILKKQSQLLSQTQQLSKIITRTQSQFIQEEGQRNKIFHGLLEEVLELTESEYGFIGEVLYNDESIPYLKIYNMSNITWDQGTHALYQSKVIQGLEFTNLNTLFGAVITTGEPVIANDPHNDPRSGGLPEGHLVMHAFLGIPIHCGDKLVAMLGIANRPGGYDQALLDFMRPLTITLGQLVEAARIKQRQQQDECRLSSVIEGTNIGIWEWNVQTGQTIFNERWAEIVGYTLAELQPINIQTWLDLAHPEDLKQSEMMLERHFSGELAYYDVKCRMRHKLGHWVWVHDRGCVMSWTSQGKPLQMFGTHADITEQVLMNDAIDQQRWLYEQILEQSMAGYWDWMLQQGTEYLSLGFKQMFGYDDHEMENRPESWQKIIFQEDLPGVLECFDQHIRSHGQVPFDNTVRYHHKNGSTVWVRCIGKVIEWGPDEQPVRMIGCHIDITDLKQSEQALKLSESRLRGLFELSPIGIALNEFDTGRFVDLNDALLAPTGYTREEFTDLSYMSITPKEYWPEEVLQLEKMEKTGRFGPFEKEYIRKDGSRYPVLLNGMVVYDPSGRKLIWSMIEDISERKRIELMKREFISTVSHELRTPLTSITGALGLLKGGVVCELPESMRDMLEIAHRNSLRLTHLINDLLDMEKIEAGKLQFKMQVQPLMPLIEQALEENRSYGTDRRVGLLLTHYDHSILVRVDSNRLMQILANLLSNAIKFSPEGSEVKISIVKKRNKVVISVTDQGPGIADSFRERIFKKFSQADSSNVREQGGTGLGLAITRELVEAMAGSIGFDSSEGAGSTFWFELPIQDHLESRLFSDELPTSSFNEASVLIVENNPTIYQVVESIANEKIDFELATTFKDASDRLRLESFSAVVLDTDLRDGSVLDLLQMIRVQQPDAKVIICYGTEISSKEACMVDFIIPKSKISSCELLDAIRVRIKSCKGRGESA
ncbi:diguanylate cyclase/phosphodiesterase (GGDEF & EAL domains) with PAS/PAC sensor(s) [Nitrincola lacisaponensis]|uniref:histidine kinase n=1 Tax=Nitrincola lacisaponensis TaxID=267850 RepID=A0A063Y2P1_9GAMM|nr:PAS domain S-box protein [Nitrincola lacisaponensis]KDE39016.1 diguanylate cyclase/phosphodiesterase (GGDEF & EAL domains) with PAS/PAC sensor(s) [Nitrincola lacisaponensis]